MTLYFEDYELGRTFPLGTTEFTEDEIVAFGEKFDPQPFHVDKAAAEAGPLGGLIASGWHVGSAAMRAAVGNYFFVESSLPSPGLEDLKWLAPVRVGDRITYSATVTYAAPSRSKPDRGVVKTLMEGVNQDGTTVLSLLAVNIMLRRPQGMSTASMLFGR